ncbi:PIN domain-like protein [Gymnopus androsaceus JB14]|uniref:PIN domain-like protein n=1 Tax=Gymnopus androsaceus JB14 TaxID=1447944 RepID=A0A6A4H0Z8_9AGAR|nr:PIN domain-like protein [Gymnopus androsaceus JB14]
MGVKSLWTLLTPVDSSIWIYQFQATMRAKDGRALVNAHVLGFLRRICKLLFYGMKPVFVFDGGAPALKRETLIERRKKKSGAAASHAKLAERLLAAQLRREALKHARITSPNKGKGKGKAPEGPVVLDDDTVYLEDIDPTIPNTPHKKEQAKEPTSSGKKIKFHDHDPYRLPDIDLQDRISKATRSSAPDPRLATEEELRSFIENMRPEDFDVTSPAFKELPTEVQYEIIGDLRLKSRQTSYTRLQQMLKSAPTPLDFSKQQIKNLKQRNSLTQQLLSTTDDIGKAHISIPVRIASERNKEYMLIRNEGATGGWILGIRDGTKQKPILIDHEQDEPQNDGENQTGQVDSEEDDEMEEVNIPEPAEIDPDLRNYHRQSALTAIARRYSPKPLAPLSTKTAQKSVQIPLFDLDDEDFPMDPSQPDHWEEDEELAFAIQESLEYSNKASLSINGSSSSSSAFRSSIDTASGTAAGSSRLETALSIANAGPSRSSDRVSTTSSLSFGRPFLLTAHKSPPISNLKTRSNASLSSEPHHDSLSSSFSSPNSEPKTNPIPVESSTKPITLPPKSPSPELLLITINSDRVTRPAKLWTGFPRNRPVTAYKPITTSRIIFQKFRHNTPKKEAPLFDDEKGVETISLPSETVLLSDDDDEDMEEVSSLGTNQETLQPTALHSRSPSPQELSDQDGSRPSTPPIEERDWDAAHEMNPDAEEGDFAHFVSQVKGRDIDDVRREIDEEIASLDQQRKNAMRDAEDINQQMVNQIMIMLRLFGIPYITAPMEAEAQCAELLSLNLVDGIITDDSDVFLFGGHRVFKNMFNQSKTVECFLLSDLMRELGLDQGTLIRLAYLLGSDYVEGLPGVGPVVAMELLREFPGDDGLHKFKDWWMKVQSGKDREDHSSPFRKRFKKKFKDLYLPADWPNAAVRDAYYHPVVDESDEPFKWGLPDLDALRAFLREELGWVQPKVDDLLLPIIQKVGKRGQANTLNRQGNLNDFLDVSSGSGTVAPRKRQAFKSKRLQEVVTDYRKKRKAADNEPASEDDNEDDEGEKEPLKKKRATKKGKKKASDSLESSTRGRKTVARGRRAPRDQTKKKSNHSSGEDDYESEQGSEADKVMTTAPLAVNLRPRPKPKLIHRPSGALDRERCFDKPK